jgi:hypothetical protein
VSTIGVRAGDDVVTTSPTLAALRTCLDGGLDAATSPRTTAVT